MIDLVMIFAILFPQKKIEREMGWKPRYQILEGLKLTMEWYVANQDKLDIEGYDPEWIK